MEKQFIEAERVAYRPNPDGSMHLRLISGEAVMYKDMTLDMMRSLRDWLDRQIENYECFYQKKEFL
jgi:hypothetical protein